MSRLIEILLPLTDASGTRRPSQRAGCQLRRSHELHAGARRGRWHVGGSTEHDDIVVIEVMAPTFDRGWWTSLKAKLEHRFSQDVIVIRAHAVEVL